MAFQKIKQEEGRSMHIMVVMLWECIAWMREYLHGTFSAASLPPQHQE
jgi:hypothetical protein